MQVEVAETGPCSRTVKIVVPPERVKQHLDEVYQSAQQQVQLKGFRPGKVPRQVIEKKFGAGILAEAKEQILNRVFGEACREKELTPVGRVVIDDLEKLEVKPGSGLEFTARIDVRPVVELADGALKGLEVEGYESEATDADVENALAEIANQKRSIKKADDPAQDGDFVKADMTFRDEGGAAVHERKNVQLNTRIPIAGTDQDEFAKALVGAVPGKKIELPLTFPDNFEKDALRGKKGTAVLQVHEVLRVTPAPIDDTLAKSLEFEDLAALKADLKARIGGEKERTGKLRQEEQALQKLLNAHPFELPSSLVEEQQQASLQGFAERLKEAGASEEEIGRKIEESKDEAHQDALRRVRMFFLIEAIARKQKLFVTETDLDAEIRALAQSNQITPAQVRDYLENTRKLGEVRLGLLERKVREFLRGAARIVDRKAK